MGQPYVGEIRMFGGNFAPSGWALCQGQVLPISQNPTLFQLIGTTYGGDGQTTFQLPDLRGRFPVHYGSSFPMGQAAGSETVTLTMNQIPAHNHILAENGVFSTDPGGNTAAYNSAASSGATAASGFLANSGGNQPHDNMQPYLVINFIISLFGIFPTQS